MQEIVLSPLGLDDVGRLVADALHCEEDSGHPLAQLVHEKTGGNPFFAIQFLTAVAEEGRVISPAHLPGSVALTALERRSFSVSQAGSARLVIRIVTTNVAERCFD